MNVNEIVISMDSNWYIDRSVRQKIGYSGENAVVEFKLEATPEEGFTYYLDVQSKKIKNIILLDDELSVTLTTEMLGEAGIKKMQIVAYNETQVKKSNIFEVEVGESINATEEVEGHFASALHQISEWIAGVYRALTGKQNKLVPGANIAIDETDPEHPVISATGGSGDTNIIAPLYKRSGSNYTCNMTYAEVRALYETNRTKVAMPQFIDNYGNRSRCCEVYLDEDYVYLNFDMGQVSQVAGSEYSTGHYILYHSQYAVGLSKYYNNWYQKELREGNGISIASDGTISVNYPNGDEVSY